MFKDDELDDMREDTITKLAVCLCVDTSNSLNMTQKEEIKEGITRYLNSIRENNKSLHSVDLSIVSYGGRPRLLREFSTLAEDNEGPEFTYEINFGTKLNSAIEMALLLLDEKQKFYDNNDIPSYLPELIIIGGSRPDDHLDGAAEQIKELTDAAGLTHFVFSVGEGEFTKDLSKLIVSSVGLQEVIRLNEYDFEGFYDRCNSGNVDISDFEADDIPLSQEKENKIEEKISTWSKLTSLNYLDKIEKRSWHELPEDEVLEKKSNSEKDCEDSYTSDETDFDSIIDEEMNTSGEELDFDLSVEEKFIVENEIIETDILETEYQTTDIFCENNDQDMSAASDFDNTEYICDDNMEKSSEIEPYVAEPEKLDEVIIDDSTAKEEPAIITSDKDEEIYSDSWTIAAQILNESSEKYGINSDRITIPSEDEDLSKWDRDTDNIMESISLYSESEDIYSKDMSDEYIPDEVKIEGDELDSWDNISYKDTSNTNYSLEVIDMDSLTIKLRQLKLNKELLDSEAITLDEFEFVKRQILGDITRG